MMNDTDGDMMPGMMNDTEIDMILGKWRNALLSVDMASYYLGCARVGGL